MLKRTSITPNTGKCAECDRETRLIAKRCSVCYKRFRAEQVRLRNAARGVAPKPSQVVVKPKKSAELLTFFDNAKKAVSANPYCLECKAFIDESAYVAAVAHILPKSIFESVADNENNYLILGARCGCHDKSHRLDKFCKMKVWTVAVTKFLKFQHLITERHKLLSTFVELAQPVINQINISPIKTTTHGERIK